MNSIFHLKKYFSEIEKAFILFNKKWFFVLLVVIFDFSFFLLLTIIHAEFFLKIQPHLNVVMQSVQEQAVAIQPALDAIEKLQTAVVQQPDVLASYHAVLLLLGLMLLSLLGVWLVFQGIAWFFANKMVYPVRASNFIKQFGLRTLLFFCLFVLLLALLSFGLQTSVSYGFLSVSSVYTIFLAMLLILGFTTSISYATRQSFSILFRALKNHAAQLVFAYIVSLFLLFVTGGITLNLVSVHWGASLAWVLLVFLPSLSLVRIYIVCVVHSATAKVSSSGKTLA